MLEYETIGIWNTIHRILVDWVESTMKEGWNIWRGEERLKEIAEELTKKIVKTLYTTDCVNEFGICRFLDLLEPSIFVWVDNILLSRADFFRDKSRVKRYSCSITSDLVRLLLDEKDLVEFI